jgi:hypothetical protein
VPMASSLRSTNISFDIEFKVQKVDFFDAHR